MTCASDGKFELKVSALKASYILPISAKNSRSRALTGYLARLSRIIDEIIVVDGSPKEVFDDHGRAWSAVVKHVRPVFKFANGKVAGVLTGMQLARNEDIIVADDDVRYRSNEIWLIKCLLAHYDVVRPQNKFVPLPWHARWDTSRSLLNRLMGGDWPGTLGARRSIILAAGGYSGDVLFENFEMVRTVRAAGGRECLALDIIIDRRPPSAKHFLSQRSRQAYDEWARPWRFSAQLSLLPVCVSLAIFVGLNSLWAVALVGIIAGEVGRRKAGGNKAFPATSALWTPAWLIERSLTSWVALR